MPLLMSHLHVNENLKTNINDFINSIFYLIWYLGYMYLINQPADPVSFLIFGCGRGGSLVPTLWKRYYLKDALGDILLYSAELHTLTISTM